MKQFNLFMICFSFVSFSLDAQYFKKVTTGPIVNTPADSRSVNWVDVNNDGWVDLFISNGPAGGQNNFLYLNNGDGNFTAVTGDSIVSDGKPSDGASFGDFDNDGDMDAFVVNWYNVNKMFYVNNGNGSFTKIDTGKLVNEGGYSETASWGDYDKDGFIDLYVTNSAGNLKNFLYHNNGNGSFTKIIVGNPVTDQFTSRCANWTDIDGDGDLDLFVTNENNQNENIYVNNGGSFTSLTTGALVKNGGNTMSASWGDYDNDGDLDVFLANDQSFNALFKNNGNFDFTKITNDTLVKTPSRSFSSAWSDVDNDGDLDLFVTNSFGTIKKQLNFFYINNGDGTFTRNNSDIIANDSAWSYGCAFADYDNDGFEDLAVATCRFGNVDQANFLYHNNGNSNKWITIKLAGTKSNRAAIGTKIRVKALINGKVVWQMRELSAQTSYCGQNDMRAHFGLGDATIIDSIKIEWPLGLIEFYTNVNVNQFLEYKEANVATQVQEKQNENDNLLIYPNPSAHSITLEMEVDPFNENDKIQLIDSLGKLIAEINPSHSLKINIDLNRYQLKPGQYSIVIRGKNRVISRKFIWG